MTAVFVHDHYFVYDKDTNSYYDGSGGVFTSLLWNRYLAVFDKLIVVGRQRELQTDSLALSSTENVEFALVTSLKSGKDRFLRRREIAAALYSVVARSDFAILRVPSSLGYIAQSICHQLKKPYMLEVVGCAWDAYWNYGTLSAKLMAPLEMLKLKQVSKGAPACVYVTKKFLQSRYPTMGMHESISNVNINVVLPKERALEVYDEFSNRDHVDGTFRIGLIGSFHVGYKGHIEALQALKLLLRTSGIANVKLLLVGSGNPSWVQELVRRYDLTDYVEIVGVLPAGEMGILPFLDSLHLYIHPSKQEGLPRVVIEAMSRGKLCLASSVAGIPELLDARFLHSPGDYKKLATDILAIYNEKDRWPEIIEQNLARANEYTEANLQLRRVQFIKKVLK